MSDRLNELSKAGVSIWLDDLSRERIETGNLVELMEQRSVVGVTTNPSIFAHALTDGDRYDAQVQQLVADGADIDRVIFEVTTTDVRNACDIMRPIYDATAGVDGRVSIEVSPTRAHDTAGTIEEARRLWETVDRPNVYIKIPASDASIPAISASLAAGININVTLIFGLDQYRQVMEAFLSGLERAHAAGKDLSKIHSVASFFVSRVDTEIDKRLDGVGSANALKGKAGVANARLAFEAYEQMLAGERWQKLAAAGALPQRPLWASTSVKDPAYPDTMYVDDLIVEGTVNTMPEGTMLAFADHGTVDGDQVRPHYADAHAHMEALAAAGIDYDDVIATLNSEGIDKFVAAWQEAYDSVQATMDAGV